MVSFFRKWALVPALLLAFTFFDTPIRSEELRIGVGDSEATQSFPPYLMVSRDRKQFTGLVYDILAEIVKITGDTVHPVFLSPARVLRGISDGDLDLDLFSNPDWRQEYAKDSIYSIPYLTSTNYFVFRKDTFFAVKSVKDLKGKRLEVVQEYHYGRLDSALKDGTIIRSDAPSETTILKRLDAGWSRVGVVDNRVFDFLVHTLKITTLVLGDKASSPMNIMMRFPASQKKERDKFNEAIVRLQKNGTIARILAKYGVHE